LNINVTNATMSLKNWSLHPIQPHPRVPAVQKPMSKNWSQPAVSEPMEYQRLHRIIPELPVRHPVAEVSSAASLSELKSPQFGEIKTNIRLKFR